MRIGLRKRVKTPVGALNISLRGLRSISIPIGPVTINISPRGIRASTTVGGVSLTQPVSNQKIVNIYDWVMSKFRR